MPVSDVSVPKKGSSSKLLKPHRHPPVYAAGAVIYITMLSAVRPHDHQCTRNPLACCHPSTIISIQMTLYLYFLFFNGKYDLENIGFKINAFPSVQGRV